MVFNDTDLHHYEGFLKTLLDKGYDFIKFHELNKSHGQVILRHDIDFDCHLALQMAELEHQYNIQSTYFFLVCNDSYNISSPNNQKYINKIKALGHEINVHFDPSIYQDIEAGLTREVQYFEMLFETKVNIISLHRPEDLFLNNDNSINGIEHTYQGKYFKNIKYFADSRGVWRYGHPFNSEVFKEGRSLHLLIHPIWWQIKGADTSQKLMQYYQKRVNELKEHMAANCIPFQKIIDHV